MRQRSWTIWLSALVIVISFACSLVSTVAPGPTAAPAATTVAAPTFAPLPALEGVIAYASERNGLWQVVAMNADGSDETSLTASYGAFSRPAWSPDGQQLALRMEIEMGSGIGVMGVHRENGKLTGAAPVAVLKAFADGPRWSPDGTRLVYVTAEGSSGWTTYTVGLSDATPVRVPGIPENATNPDWSPDGNRIVFSNYADPKEQVNDLYVINLDGSGLLQLTNTPTLNENEPIWSPDGNRIVFTSLATEGDGSLNPDLFIMNADGTGVSRVTTDPGKDFDASWSPDGKQIVFVSDRHANNDSNFEVYVIKTDGTGELRLTNNAFIDRWPTWRAKQPDDVSATDCASALTLAGDVTIPAGTRFAQPQPFSKVWRLKNSGTCTWTPTDYAFRRVEGEEMSELAEVRVPGAIQPGATFDLAIPQVAPDVPGRHFAHWQLFRRNGQPVTGSDGSPVTLAVDIEVLQPGQAVLPAPLYFLSEQGGSAQIWRMETDARTVAQITREYQPVTAAEVSPTGKLAYISQNQVMIADANGANRQVVGSLEAEAPLPDLAWSADGRQLAYASQGIHVYDTTTGQDRLLIADQAAEPPNLLRYGPVAWSPDGSKLAATVYMWESAGTHILSTSGGAVLADLPQQTTIWNRDSQSVYLASPYYSEWTGIESGLWRGPATGEAPQSLIQGASIWWPAQRGDGTLAYFMHQPTTRETKEYSALLYVSQGDGSSPVAVKSWPIFITINDTFNGVWTEDGQSILLQLVRPALDASEVLLLSTDDNPPLFVTSEMKAFWWGK